MDPASKLTPDEKKTLASYNRAKEIKARLKREGAERGDAEASIILNCCTVALGIWVRHNSFQDLTARVLIPAFVLLCLQMVSVRWLVRTADTPIINLEHTILSIIICMGHAAALLVVFLY
jgi:hypothetical protein